MFVFPQLAGDDFAQSFNNAKHVLFLHLRFYCNLFVELRSVHLGDVGGLFERKTAVVIIGVTGSVVKLNFFYCFCINSLSELSVEISKFVLCLNAMKLFRSERTDVWLGLRQ